MTQRTTDILTTIKASAFPVLLALVGFFLNSALSKLDRVEQKQEAIMAKMSAHDQNHIDIERRLENAENRINQLSSFQVEPRANTEVHTQFNSHIK
jgi:hypothetical protein